MAITIRNLGETSTSYTRGYTWADLHLPMSETSTKTNWLQQPTHYTELQIDYDEAAIRNSIYSIMNTSEGEMPLNPRFGICSKLKSYLFNPLTVDTARLIGETILEAITQYEPRVKVLRIRSVPDFERDLYDIKLLLQLPTLNTNIELQGELKSIGFELK